MSFGGRRNRRVTITTVTDTKTLSTGQTTDRTPAGRTCHDDGYNQRGISHQYEVLTGGQHSGTTDITINGKTDSHSNECVQCLSSGLMWARYVSSSVGPSSDGRVLWDDTAGNNEDAFAYVDAANTANFAGYNDWRLPNIFELARLGNYEVSDGQPGAVTFPGGVDSAWSNTTAPSDITRAMFYRGTDGFLTYNLKSNAAEINYVLLVRSAF